MRRPRPALQAHRRAAQRAAAHRPGDRVRAPRLPQRVVCAARRPARPGRGTAAGRVQRRRRTARHRPGNGGRRHPRRRQARRRTTGRLHRVRLVQHRRAARRPHRAGADRPARGRPRRHDRRGAEPVTSTWPPVDADSPFGVHNLPYGVFTTTEDPTPRIGVAIGEHVLDVGAVAQATGSDHAGVLSAANLNPLMAAGRAVWTTVRAEITAWLTDTAYRRDVRANLTPRQDATMHLPFEVADYVDFYASEHHARNIGQIFRPNGDPLTPNWKHLPIGYHGRAGTVVVSGTDIVRPSGQRKAPDAAAPTYGPCLRLDIEAEVGFVVGTPSKLGEPVALADFREHVFGVCLVNDWSARDIQAWEYVPLGPFLGKSFATSVSPWIVPLDALAHAWVDPPERDVEPLPYLNDRGTEPGGLDLDIAVSLNGHTVSRPPFRTMYWTAAQQLAHMTVNGASLRTGDFYASGTVSGPDVNQRGAFIEITWNGRDPVKLPDGSTRSYLEDGDEVTITATAPGPNGTRITLGEVTGRITPTHG
ncbi:MAG: fumarylacetoacetase [Streptomycetaceae bacterium]|nr:fumarylacetoacetase [Streptomycetaceae bacterium]